MKVSDIFYYENLIVQAYDKEYNTAKMCRYRADTDRGDKINMMQKNEHRITRILPGSIAEELEIEPGDVLLLVNDHEIKDVFDYRYQINEEYLTITDRKSVV